MTLHLPSSAAPTGVEAARIDFKNAVGEVAERLGRDDSTVSALRALVDDDEFWRTQGRGLAVFAAPDVLHAFTLQEEPRRHVHVNDRFELGPLLRASGEDGTAFVLVLTEGRVALQLVDGSHRIVEVPLDLPADLHTVLEHADNQGQADLPRAGGADGPRPERRRFASTVQDAVLGVIGTSRRPLVLAASADLGPAYRAVNRYDALLPDGIEGNPASLTVGDLIGRTTALLDADSEDRMRQWRELFGTRRSNGLATTRLKEVARAVAASGVEELVFDKDAVVEGTLDEFGTLDRDAADGYNVVNELAVQVLRAGGRVRGVRREQLLDGSPVAALLRFPVA